MTVRSRRLFGPITIGPGAGSNVYTVPADRTTVVRSLTIAAVGATNVPWTVSVSGVVAIRGTTGSGATSSLPYLVLNPGDVLRVNNVDAVGTIAATGSGAELLGAPA